MATEETTGGRARSADGRFASKATGAAVIAPTAEVIPANTPEPEKAAKKADSKKKAAKKADSKKKAAKKADSKKKKKK